MSFSDSYGRSERYLGAAGEAYFAKQYSLSRDSASLIARKFAHRILPEHTVLDFGCGGGYLLAALPCRRRIGVDVNPAARQIAAGLGIECHPALSEVEDCSVDVAITHHAVEHIPSPIEALSAIRKKLRLGGLLQVCVPIDDWRIQKRYCPDDCNHHLYTWTPQLLGNCLSEAGFSVAPSDVQILRYAVVPRFLPLYRRLPRLGVDALLACTAIFIKRREVLATVARED